MIILAATPIGNLGDASRRLIDALGSVAVIAAEDTRSAQRLLQGLAVEARPTLIAMHDHNERQRAAEIVERARTEDVLVLSDAGMPTVSDPGFHLVEAAAAAGVTVTALPGPSAVLTALALAGLPTDRFTFDGFLPRKGGDRRAFLRSLATERRTIVFFESPHRIVDALADLAAIFGADRRMALCRELTKLHEEIIRGTVTEVIEAVGEGVRGEICLVVEGAAEELLDLPGAIARVQALVAGGERASTAAAQIAEETGHPRRELYQAVLDAKRAAR